MSSVLHVGRRALYHQCPPPLFLTRALPRGLEERQPPFDDEASRLRGDPTLLQRAERTEEACAGPRARAGTTSSGRRDFLNLDGRARVSPRPVQTPHLRPLDCPASGEKSVLFILKVQMKKQVLRVSLPACLMSYSSSESHRNFTLSGTLSFSGPWGPHHTIAEECLYPDLTDAGQ